MSATRLVCIIMYMARVTTLVPTCIYLTSVFKLSNSFGFSVIASELDL